MFDQTERRIGVCVDINLSGEDLIASEKIRERVSQRFPKGGLCFYKDERRQSYLVGGEKTLLVKIANKYINGDNVDVDGIYTGGINVAAILDFLEYKRLLTDPEIYTILSSFDYKSSTPFIGVPSEEK